MKSKMVRFGRAIVLSVLFFLSIFSLLGGHGNPASGWNTAHIWSGGLLLIGSAVHLGTNLDWVRAVFSRPASTLKKNALRNYRTDLGLMISGMICSLTGLLWLLLSVAGPALLRRWNGLHTLSGIFMIGLLGIHLGLHWNWMVKTARQLRTAERSVPEKALLADEAGS